MGLLGLLYPLITGSAHLIKGIQDWKSNKENSKTRLHQNGLTYTDSTGRSRLVKNDRIVVYHTNFAGDKCLYDATTHKMIRNFTQAQKYQFMSESKQAAIKKGLTAYKCEDSSFCKDTLHNDKQRELHIGERYRDIETDHMLVEKMINGFVYFFDMEDNCLLRLSDNELKYRKRNPDRVKNNMWGEEIDIDKFNEQRNAFKKKYFGKPKKDPDDFENIQDYFTMKNINMNKPIGVGVKVSLDPFVIKG